MSSNIEAMRPVAKATTRVVAALQRLLEVLDGIPNVAHGSIPLAAARVEGRAALGDLDRALDNRLQTSATPAPKPKDDEVPW